MEKEIRRDITGFIKRIGICAGPDSATDLQFILDNNDEFIYVVGAEERVGLMQVGDHVSFTFNSQLLMAARNVESGFLKILNAL